MIKLNEIIKKDESITLYYKEGNSDKVYTAILKDTGKGWVVNAQWGRRGSSMQTGMKTNVPVSYDEAKKIYDKLVKSKMAKGYNPGKTGIVYKDTEDKTERQTGLYPQLLNPITDEELEERMTNDVWGAQEKYDGKRIMIIIGRDVVGVNRKGLTVELPENLINDLSSFDGMTIDGELIGETYHVFDIVRYENKGIFTYPYKDRYNILKRIPFSGSVEIAPLAMGESQKRKLYDLLKKNKKEGIVFKRLDAPYKAGRPASMGTQLKYKFWESTTAEVSRINQKRSIGLKLLDGNGLNYIEVGNCTVPPNYPMPNIGDMVEIKYLYAYRGGSLYQPQYLGIRDDKDVPDKITQIKFKNEESE